MGIILTMWPEEAGHSLFAARDYGETYFVEWLRQLQLPNPNHFHTSTQLTACNLFFVLHNVSSICCKHVTFGMFGIVSTFLTWKFTYLPHSLPFFLWLQLLPFCTIWEVGVFYRLEAAGHLLFPCERRLVKRVPANHRNRSEFYCVLYLRLNNCQALDGCKL